MKKLLYFIMGPLLSHIRKERIEKTSHYPVLRKEKTINMTEKYFNENPDKLPTSFITEADRITYLTDK